MKNRRSHRSGKESRSIPTGESTFYEKAAVAALTTIPMLAMAGYGSVDVWSIIPLAALTLILIYFWAADAIRTDEFRFSTSYLQLPLVILLLLGCAQLLPLRNSTETGLSPDGLSSLTLDPFATRIFDARLFLLLFYFAAALCFLNGKRRLQKVALAVTIFGSVMAFVGILQRLASPDAIYGMRPTPQAIPFGPFVNQHHFAAFMEMTIGLTLAAFLGGASARDRKPLYLIGLALMALAVIMTGSRGGVIGVLATAAAVVAASYIGDRTTDVRSGRGMQIKLALGAAAVLIAAALGALFLSGADPLVRGIGMQSGQGDLTSGRTHFWSVALQIFSDNPIIGAGMDAFGVAFTRYDTWNGYFRVEQAHNDYLQILADGGILAFACVMAFVVLLLWRGIKVIRNSTSVGRRSVAVGALAGCIGILVHSFFDFPLRTVSNSYFFLLLAAMATVSLVDEKED